MDYLNIGLFGLMKAKLSYLSAQQGVLAQNVANADTPGYKAKDIAAPDFKKMLGATQKLAMTTTDPGHIASKTGAGGGFMIEKRKNTDELKPDGNNVSIEEEMSKVSENQADYQKVLGMYGKTVTMFKTAIGNTSGS